MLIAASFIIVKTENNAISFCRLMVVQSVAHLFDGGLSAIKRTSNNLPRSQRHQI